MAERRDNPVSGTKRLMDDDLKANAAIDEVAAEVGHATPFTVRETHRIYRLRSERFVAVVAADTVEEARALAAGYDLRGGTGAIPTLHRLK
jgi:GGDEF domain-containing protein